jgi:hypothetical protein
VALTKVDLDDQRWLDQQIATLGDGIEAARDIWLNWTDNRNVSRLAGGLSYGDFIASRLGYALPLAEVMRIMPGASTREIAKVAGVSDFTVRGARNLAPDDQPTRVTGADGKSYPGRVVREVKAEVIETSRDSRPFLRDLGRMFEAYSPWLADRRFEERFGPLFEEMRRVLEVNR